jgi:peptidoglycan/LPS O-acetylase OafA/YrhL
MADTLAVTAPSPEKTTSQHHRMPHIRALDGVRGLAIFLVLLIHLLQSNNKPTGSLLINIVLKVKQSGWIGVDLFFALSGFLITGILIDSLGEKHYFRNFYARRALRIFPLYYGILLIIFLFLRPTWTDGRQFYLLLVYLQNTALWWHGSQPVLLKSLTGHLWSLAAEEQFYLIWPIIVVLFRDRRKLMWIAAGLVLAVPFFRTFLFLHGVNYKVIYTSTFCRADSLLAGAWLALAVRGDLKDRLLRIAPYTFWVSLLCYIAIGWKAGSFYWDYNPIVTTIGYSVLAVAASSLIAMALRPGSRTGAFMDLYPLRWLGKYSYGIYIIHPMIGFLYLPWIDRHVHGKVTSHIAVFVAAMLVTLPLAWLSYNFYERRFLRLKRYFA